MLSLALDGAHCFALRGSSIIRIHQESDYITNSKVHLGVPMDYNASLSVKYTPLVLLHSARHKECDDICYTKMKGTRRARSKDEID